MDMATFALRSAHKGTTPRLQVLQPGNEDFQRLRGRRAYDALNNLGAARVIYEQPEIAGNSIHPWIKIVTSTLLNAEAADMVLGWGDGRGFILALDHTAPNLEFSNSDRWSDGGVLLPAMPDDFPVLPVRAVMQTADVIMCSYESAAKQAYDMGLPGFWVPDYNPEDPATFIRDLRASVKIARESHATRLKKAGVRCTWRHQWYRWQSKMVTIALLDRAADEVAKKAH